MDPQVTRRTLLAGAGAAAAAATIGTLATTASAQGDPSDPLQGGSAALQQEAGDLLPAALTPGLVYVPMDMSSFFPIDTSTVVRSVSTSGVTVTPSNVILTDIPVPQGGVLKEVILAYRAPAAPAMEVAMFKTPLASGTVMVQPFTPVPTGAGILSATFPFNETADQTTYLLDVQINAAGQTVVGALAGYLPPPQAFVPISPINRVLDTRTTGGKLQANEERTIDLHIPTFARAAVINLTVTNTEIAGFAAVFPADVAYPGNSSINWSASNQNIANGVITATDPTGKVKIRGGVNPTDAVIDVQGFLL